MGSSIPVDTKKLRYEKYLAEFAKILNYALRKDGQYIEVAGGFRAAFRNKQIRYPSAAKYRRGCEEECMGVYDYLKDRGQIEGAHIPSWMISEGWIK